MKFWIILPAPKAPMVKLPVAEDKIPRMLLAPVDVPSVPILMLLTATLFPIVLLRKSNEPVDAKLIP